MSKSWTGVGPEGSGASQTVADAAEVSQRFLLARQERYAQKLAILRAGLTASARRPTSLLARRRFEAAMREGVRALRASPVWSDDEYRLLHPDVAKAGVEPARHYVEYGWRELRRPHPLFDTGWYLLQNRDVLASGINPLLHYLRHGAVEGRRPNVGFDGEWYLERNQDVAAAGMNPLAHYACYGAAEERWPHPLFDPKWYALEYLVPATRPWAALAHYISQGAAQDLRPNAWFDPSWYRLSNLDVGAADLEPVAHYLELGWRDSREPCPNFFSRFESVGFPRNRALGPPLVALLHNQLIPPADVVYVGHGPANLSHSYRVQHPVEILEAAGVSARWIRERDLRSQMTALHSARVVVFARMAWTPEIEQAVKICRKSDTLVAFEIDDYVFDPDVANATHVDGLRFVASAEVEAYHRGVELYRRMLRESDVVLASTPILVEAARALGTTGHLLENGSRSVVIKTSAHAEAQRRNKPGEADIVIGYASGTKTHQRDFAVAVPALARILEEFPATRLQVVGAIDVSEFPALRQFVARITVRPPVQIDELPYEYARFDINLAPLEIGNPYCEAKSALKFIEAGLVSVPTVASATEPFRRAIADGETGFLASTPEEWYEKLKLLVTNVALRREVGRRAKQENAEEAPRRHRDATISIFAQLLGGLPKKQAGAIGPVAPIGVRKALAAGKLRIGWIVPGLIIGGGGHRNILRAAHFLQQFGHDVALYFTMDEGRTAAEFRRLVQEHFYPFEGDILVYSGRGRGDDVVLATHWTTVTPALAMQPEPREVMYFVQDFEPSFAAMSSEYILAENTYRKGLYAITSGVWCERVLRREFGMEADHFRFPIDRDIYHPRPKTRREDRIVFFAKPEMPRRCFELGVDALRAVHRKRPDVEIVFFGSTKARGLVDYPVTFRDVLPGIGDLADLYASARLGVVFSTTNPSLVPYEMMACGLPVVDLARPGNEANYGDRFDIAFLANPEPEIMAEEVARLIADGADLAARSRNGLSFAAGFPTELEMARRVETLILDRLKRHACPGGEDEHGSPRGAGVGAALPEASATI